MDDSEASWSSEYSDSLKNNISDAFSEPSTEDFHHPGFHLRKIRKMYNHIRQVLGLCDVDLPSRKTVQSAKSQLLKKTHCKEKMSVSIMGNPITTVIIQVLLTQCSHKVARGGLASKSLNFFSGDIYKFSQSAKWLHQHPRDLRVQMINVGDKSYYIYEPAQLKDGNVVVPIYFYIKGGIMFAKVCKLNVFVLSSSEVQISIFGDLDFYASDLKEIMAQDFLKPYIEIKAHDGRLLADKCRNILLENSEEIHLPNEWRIKAQGKMIRHIPLNIYSDDTSGNLSKQWNKHISICMTLSGLSPLYSNQEYNTMFVATSNIASALELCAPVIEELNTLSSTGFWAYDSSLNEDVLVMPVVLLFMGDSPIHAEISSSMHPNVSLQPCRICCLKADSKKEKATANYVQRFIGHNSKGFQAYQLIKRMN
ncbi:hypothetical protein PPACK8108_LOCUS4994 [Phakopsora pachyrhizi]|uniref:Uncharacterized protein n=1 Tax=Phakopsora pachyrhizi TaxID=170000 RepID=A0AAV0APY5_PHAPC|nr:hypothetical protein PPACK8108_LOCUS4994 [Phakopsora pachyrhizi]